MSNEEENNQIVEPINQEATTPKIGRPKGSKDSKKRVSLFIKMQAKALYIAGHSPMDIAKAVGIAHEQQITNWAAKENWDIERDRVLDLSTSEMVKDMMNNLRKSFSDLKTFKQIAIDTVVEKGLNPKKFSEAVNAYATAFEMEYKIKNDSLHVSFLRDVSEVLKEEIQDVQQLNRIFDKLDRVMEKHQQKQLLPPLATKEE